MGKESFKILFLAGTTRTTCKSLNSGVESKSGGNWPAGGCTLPQVGGNCYIPWLTTIPCPFTDRHATRPKYMYFTLLSNLRRGPFFTKIYKQKWLNILFYPFCFNLDNSLITSKAYLTNKKKINLLKLFTWIYHKIKFSKGC